jgi:hypothetical protein
MARRIVVVKKQDSGKPIQKSTSLEVSIKCIVSVGNGDRDRTFEEWIDAIREAVHGIDCPEGAQIRFTPTGGYYIVNGRVCLPDDFDPETKDFKPGTRPPLWASTEPEKKQWEILDRIEREKNNPNTLARNPPNLATLAESSRPGRRTVTVQRGKDFAWKDESDAEDVAGTVTEKAADNLVSQVSGKRVVVVRRGKKS